MLKVKLKFLEKARKALPDRHGSIVAAFEDEDKENGSSNKEFEAGEELKTFLPDGISLSREIDYHNDCFEHNASSDIQTKIQDLGHLISGLEIINDSEKWSELDRELAQNEINLEKLRRIASTGLPDGGGFRATTWKLLLGYLPTSRDLWDKELSENRLKYAKLKEELLLSPSELSRRNDGALESNEHYVDSDAGGPLERQKISTEDHPLNLGKDSMWHQYFEFAETLEQIDRDLKRTHPNVKFFSGDSPMNRANREAMRNILLLFAKSNPAISYVQGMNEILAPLYFVFRTDTDEQNAVHGEADSFSCFLILLSDSMDHFCQQMDHSSTGILSTLSKLSELLKANDQELWQHLEFTTKVNPQFYAFRWITLLLTQEFSLPSILRIWDCLLSNPYGIQEMLLRVCVAMLFCAKNRLMKGDFVDNLRLLQHYPDINIDHLLHVTQRLIPATTSSHLPFVM